jgi:transcriptional regulator with XRE-family HTH domain
MRSAQEEGSVLAELIDQRYESRQRFADDLGVSKNVVSDIVRGRTRLRGPRREKAARLLGVDVKSLLPLQQGLTSPAIPDLHSNIKGEIPVAPAGWRHVPVYGALAAGAMSYTYSDVLEWEIMPEWGGDFERWGRIVSGDSMNDEFEDGDIVIFENRRFESGHAVHAFAEGEDTFKIYVKDTNGEERLKPLNPDFPALEAKKYTVKGIVIRRIRKGPKGIRDIREYPNGFRE